MRLTRAGLGLLVLAGCPVDVALPEGSSTTGTSNSGGGTDSMGTSGAPLTGGGEETAVPTTGAGLTTTHALGDTEGTSSGSSTGGESSSSGDAEGSSSGEVGSSSSSGGDVAPFCGDGHVDPGEGCDDGNGLADDGCSPACEVGPGAEVVTPVPLVGGERLRCLAIVDKQLLDGVSHGLALGSTVDSSPEEVMRGRVQGMPLQGGVASWSYLEGAGIYGRSPVEAVATADGGVVVAGLIVTEDVQVDSGGYLWLARFSAAGELLWNVEAPALSTVAVDLAMTSGGDFVIAGHTAGFSFGVYAHRFRGSDGSLVWSYDEVPSDEIGRNYTSMALDEDDNVYLGGVRWKWTWPEPEEPGWLFVRALDAEGGERWTFERDSELQLDVEDATLAVTTDGQLMVFAAQREEFFEPTTFMITGLDLEGTQLWSQSWAPAIPEFVVLTNAVAAPDGGVYVTGGIGAWAEERITARFDAAGVPVWVNTSGTTWGVDIELDPDGVPHVLTYDSVISYLP